VGQCDVYGGGGGGGGGARPRRSRGGGGGPPDKARGGDSSGGRARGGKTFRGAVENKGAPRAGSTCAVPAGRGPALAPARGGRGGWRPFGLASPSGRRRNWSAVCGPDLGPGQAGRGQADGPAGRLRRGSCGSRGEGYGATPSGLGRSPRAPPRRRLGDLFPTS